MTSLRGVVVSVQLEEEERLARLAFVHFGFKHVHGNRDTGGDIRKS
jgi:hypothetical protein